MKLHIKPFQDYQVGPGYSLSCAEGLTAYTGSVTVVTGDSGSGKSVLLKVLAGYRWEISGSTEISAHLICGQDGRPLSFPDFRRQGIHFSFLPQESVLRPYLTPSRRSTHGANCSLPPANRIRTREPSSHPSKRT